MTHPEVYNKQTREEALGNIDTDIDYEDYNNNANTFIGYYAGIIQRVRSVQPRCFIFVMTVPRSQHAGAPSYSAAIRQIASKFPFVYCIDLESYAVDFRNAKFNELYFLNGHMSASGYTYMALTVNQYVDFIIKANAHDFKNLSLSTPGSSNYGRTLLPTYSYSGVVTMNGSPLSGATIVTYAGNLPHTVISDSSGGFTTTAGTGKLIVYYDGKPVYEDSISINADTSNVQIDIV